MPELPEVERARRLADRHLTGKRITQVRTVPDRIVYHQVGPRRFAAHLRGAWVLGVHRHGKYLWLQLNTAPHPVLHFGMSGSLRVYHQRRERPRFWKLEIQTGDGTYVAMPNPRRLGRIRLVHDPRNQPPLSRLGFDCLADLPRSRQLATMLAQRKCPIKALLLDQTFAAGVGNWIADEVLYQAGIDPRRPARELRTEEVDRLRRKLYHVIHKAVAVDADKDRFPRSWLFHVRWGKVADAHTADGKRIEHITVAGRTTAFVPGHQR